MADQTQTPLAETLAGRKKEDITAEERFFAASQWELMWRKFRKHKLALASLCILLFLYLVAFTFEFWAPYGPFTDQGLVNAPPTPIHLFHDGQFIGPFVYGIEQELDVETFKRIMTENTSVIYPIRLLQPGDDYRFWGLIPGNLHFFGAGEGQVLLLGTDDLGRDLFSRILAGSRVSLTIGVVGVFVSLIMGSIVGGLAGYYGAWVDLVVSRIIEFIGSIPNLPLWMLMASIIPLDWPIMRVYFMTTLIISLLTWVGLARVVRSQLLQLRTQDFVKAAKLAGASDSRLIIDHLLPGMLSYLIVRVTIAIPQTILAETSLSFLGLGLRPPAVSWGVLLRTAQNIQNIILRPWMLSPAVVVILTIFVFNFVGDGLRDAADPYK